MQARGLIKESRLDKLVEAAVTELCVRNLVVNDVSTCSVEKRNKAADTQIVHD